MVLIFHSYANVYQRVIEQLLSWGYSTDPSGNGDLDYTPSASGKITISPATAITENSSVKASEILTTLVDEVGQFPQVSLLKPPDLLKSQNPHFHLVNGYWNLLL